MTLIQQIVTIAICVIATMLTRFLPFMIFSSDKPTPKYIKFLGQALPPAVFGMLIVYCLRNTEILTGAHGLPELASILLITILHIWKKNMLLSIFAGTACYMLLTHFVF